MGLMQLLTREGVEKASDWTLLDLLKGGPGSGHHGHKGRPGQRGGSSPGGVAGGTLESNLAGLAVDNGFPADLFVLSDAKVSLEGMPVLAGYDRRAGKVVIYGSAPKQFDKLAPIAVHELMHVRTEQIPNGEMASYIKGIVGIERWRSEAWRSMGNTGRVSDFAAWTWDNQGGNKAVRETLSEIARLDYQGELGAVDSGWQTLYGKAMAWKA